MSTTTVQMSDSPEARLFAGFEFRDVDTTDSLRWLEGRAVPYGEWANIGWYLEAFDAGSLAKSIKEAARRLPINAFHESGWFPIGSAETWKDGDRDLWGVWRLDEDDELAQRVARAAKRGDLTGLSIEFAPIRSEWSEPEFWDPNAGADFMDKCVRKEARLGAVGVVQTPAYVSAGVIPDLVRSADARRRLEAGRVEARRTPVLDAMRARTSALRGSE